jgi:hypothetical protein
MNPAECQTCERPSSNKQFSCPPRMADGRHFTDYKPRCYGDRPVELIGKPMNSYEYRQYLITNAEGLMNSWRDASYQANMCGPCVEPYNVGTMLPEQSKVECNSSLCSVKPGHPNGLGQGRDYMNGATDKAAEHFLSQKEVENSKLKSERGANCCATPFDDMQFYPLDGMAVGSRWSVPSGGAPFEATSR